MTRKRVYPNLGTFLEDLKRNGSTQAEFAERLGMSNGYLSDLKNGKVRPSLALAKQLSDECGIPIESFLTDGEQRVS